MAGKRRHNGSRSYYVHKYAAFGKEVLRAPWMEGEMAARAEKIKAAAIALSPVDTGEYIGSFEVSTGIRATGKGKRRAYGRVTNTSGHAQAVEFGWANTPRHRVLGRAAGTIGGTLGAGA